MEEFLEILKQIIQKNADELFDYEKDFLRARQSYLTEDEKQKFANVIREVVEVEEVEDVDGIKKIKKVKK